MRIIILAHPSFLNSSSMPLFANMLKTGMLARGHSVEVWQPAPYFYRLGKSNFFKKWLGYLDQYCIFPWVLRAKVSSEATNTLYVFSDQALGPWVPTIACLPHVIHCHDFMALRSALGLIKENPTRATGRLYQKYIRNGFSYGKNFISISKKTRADLHNYGQVKPKLSEVVFNGLNYPYVQLKPDEAKSILMQGNFPDPSDGFLLHVGGAQWYKNRVGVIDLYIEYVKKVKYPKPLWLIGPKNDNKIRDALNLIPDKGSVYLLSGLSPEELNAAYSLSSLFIFPSLDEGFGWPIAEAMASGTVVITTGEAPMTEVGGDAAVYIPRKTEQNSKTWASQCAEKIIEVLSWPTQCRVERVNAGIAWVEKNFDPNLVLDTYEAIYSDILRKSIE